MADSRTIEKLIAGTDRARWPRRHSAERADRLRGELESRAADLDLAAADLLCLIASGSPFLERTFRLNLEVLTDLLRLAPDAAIDRIVERAEAARTDMEAPATLRSLKKQVAMVLSILDLSGLWDDRSVMAGLSRFADAAVIAAFDHALREVTGATGNDVLAEQAGFAVYAMGKHGACELNYSSDIDLVIFHQTKLVEAFLAPHDMTEKMKETRRFLDRTIQRAMATLQDQTAEGYVFRTDLRLRPDPGSSSASVSVSAAEHYYETYGQNWERAAFIKARFIAGDERTANVMNDVFTPFIWRKYLDYSAIEDIHSIKRQIHAVRGQADFVFEGHDIKLGRGGIREIEFFVQTQQLILGGRIPSLREKTTLGGLQALVGAGQVEEKTCEELSAAYLFLRHLEHRIQMVNDEQTHEIPEREEEIARLAHLSGYDDGKALKHDVVETLKVVHDHYANLFHEEEDLSAGIGSLVFTGVDHDPQTLRTLAELGFKNPQAVSATVRKWHQGTMRATKSARGRALLTKLVPSIIRACANVDEPDAALAAFDGFLRNLPGGVQVFSLMLNNLEILDLVAGLVSVSPRLAREMAVHGRLVEVLLDEAFLQRSDADITIDDEEILDAVDRAVDYEDALNALRREDREVWFQISCRLLLERSAPRDAARNYAALADIGIGACVDIAMREMVEAHGQIDGSITVIGMGRLGAVSLTATSDLDLIFIYDAPADAESKGCTGKALDATTWYTRYVRRLVTALSAQTEEGELYEIDMALRPSGGSGPAAVSRNAFETYYRKDAWTWEEMALVKARIIAGNDDLADKLDRHIEKILTRRRDPAETAQDVIDMRRRLLENKPGRSVLDVKLAHGGLTDIDFICQYLSLIHAAEKGRFPAHIADALPVMADLGLMERKDAETLVEAARGYEAVIQVTRITLDRGADPSTMPAAVRRLIARKIGLDDPEAIESWLEARQAEVRGLFERYVGAL